MLSTARTGALRMRCCWRVLQCRSSGSQSERPRAIQLAPSPLTSAAALVERCPDKIQPYLKIMRADKPIGTWLLFWPCTWSIAMATPAGELPSLYLLSLFGTGSFLMRGAGCVINDLWDKDFDRRVERTKNRPLACGAMSEKQAVGLLAGLLSSSLAVLMQLNWFSVAVGASSMLLVVGYPLAKRYTYWPQFVLGMTFNWGAILGWAAVRGDLTAAPALLYTSTLAWTLVYDTIYAHQDKADDVLIGVKSTALRFGEQTPLWLGGFGTAMTAGLGAAGYITDQTWPYYAALAATAGHVGWQVCTVNIHDGADCWNKFKSNSWVGVILFAGIVASTLLKDDQKKKKEDDNMVDRTLDA